MGCPTEVKSAHTMLLPRSAVNKNLWLLLRRERWRSRSQGQVYPLIEEGEVFRASHRIKYALRSEADKQLLAEEELASRSCEAPKAALAIALYLAN